MCVLASVRLGYDMQYQRKFPQPQKLQIAFITMAYR